MNRLTKILCFFGSHLWEESDSWGWRSTHGHVISVDAPTRKCLWCGRVEHQHYTIVFGHPVLLKQWS